MIGPFVSEGGFDIAFDSLIGWTYALEATTDIRASSWTPITSVPGTGVGIVIQDRQPVLDRKLYRIEARPLP